MARSHGEAAVPAAIVTVGATNELVSVYQARRSYAGTSVSKSDMPRSPWRYPMLTSLAAWSP
jgi:hypothetical protein